MSYAPQNLLDVREYIQAHTGLSDNDLGIVGDKYHTSGYHLGRDRLPANDYSNRLPRDKAGLTNAASASDIGNFSQLRELTSFVLDRCRDGRMTQIRAINGPWFDGRAYRWDSQNNWQAVIKPRGDSHETHAHLEWWRDTEHQDKTWIFREFFEGDDAMFCRLGDKSEKVLAMQVMIVDIGGRVGTSADPYADCDGSYGPNTSAGLSAAVGGGGDYYGPWQYAALHRKHSLPGPKGDKGDPGVKGDKGDPGTFVGATFTATGTFTQGS